MYSTFSHRWLIEHRETCFQQVCINNVIVILSSFLLRYNIILGIIFLNRSNIPVSKNLIQIFLEYTHHSFLNVTITWIYELLKRVICSLLGVCRLYVYTLLKDVIRTKTAKMIVQGIFLTTYRMIHIFHWN